MSSLRRGDAIYPAAVYFFISAAAQSAVTSSVSGMASHTEEQPKQSGKRRMKALLTTSPRPTEMINAAFGFKID